MALITPTAPTGSSKYAVSGPIGVAIPASGTSGCSSTDFAGSGPWYIEHQSLRGYYKRVPVYSPSATTFSLTKPTCDYMVNYTQLQTWVVAEYSVRKSTDCFTTSAYTQLQEFEWFGASSDAYGNSYGAIGVSALGPDGLFQTVRPWIRRRFWNDSTDTESDTSIGGARFYFVSPPHGATTNWHWVGATNNNSLFFGDFERIRGSQWENTFLDDGEFTPFGFQDYSLPLSYTTSQESPILIANYIDGLGTNVTNSQLFRLEWDSTTQAVPQDQGIAAYDINRHLWT